MSSFTRTIQRTAKREGAAAHYMGRGSKLGYTNPNAPTKHHAHKRAMIALKGALTAR